jgi:hypothetical protein
MEMLIVTDALRSGGDWRKKHKGMQMTEGGPEQEVAKQQPDSVFETPLENVNEILLTKGEKLATLERWRLSILGELDASNEGMATRGYGSKQLKVLVAIREAKACVHHSVKPEEPINRLCLVLQRDGDCVGAVHADALACMALVAKATISAAARSLLRPTYSMVHHELHRTQPLSR